MASVNQTLPHCVNQMGKTHSKSLAARHGRGMGTACYVWIGLNCVHVRRANMSFRLRRKPEIANNFFFNFFHFETYTRYFGSWLSFRHHVKYIYFETFYWIYISSYNTQKRIFRRFCILSSDGNRTSFQKDVLQQKVDCETSMRLVCNVSLIKRG